MLSIYYITLFHLRTTLVDNIIIPVLQMKKWMTQPVAVEHRWLSAGRLSVLSRPSHCAKREISYSENANAMGIFYFGISHYVFFVGLRRKYSLS